MAGKRICSIPGCDKPVNGQGLCNKHYNFHRRRGTITVKARKGEEPICKIEGCHKPRLALGMCQNHYVRSRRKPGARQMAPKGAPAAHLAKLTAEPPQTDECVLWPYARRHGYGVLKLRGGKNLSVTRRICELVHGPAPEGAFACHSCDNPPCVNGRHLYWGSPADNSRDAVERGRYPKGEGKWNARLTEAAVVEIITSPESGNKISKRLGVDRAVVSRIRNKKAWAHIDPKALQQIAD